ncbi:12255_t:CDS:2 [Gigaspora rosea]|nr:12255_t:CDS:2 [Gigaspora rosea]
MTTNLGRSHLEADKLDQKQEEKLLNRLEESVDNEDLGESDQEMLVEDDKIKKRRITLKNSWKEKH